MRRVLAVLGAGALASGCSASTSTTIDNEKAQASVAEIVRDQVGSRVKSVSCPDDVPVSKGATFTCTVTGQDATTGKVSAKVTDPDKGRLFVSAPSLLHVRDAEQKIIAELAEQGGPPEKVACPELITVRKGGPFVCRATTQGQTVDVRATATDGNGNFTFKTVRPTIIPSKAEALVTQLARDRLGIRVRSVSCPGGVALRKGATFTCTVTGRDGTAGRVPGEVTSRDKGGTVFVSPRLLLSSRKLKQQMTAFLRKQVKGARVSCPDVITIRKGATFTCKATAANGQTADVRTTMTDSKGAVTYRIVPTG